jgi:alanyl-tRNA synthetase
MKVETTWLPRNEAEARYGFRLYQGGAVPGKDIRVVKTGDWDVEACAGTHLGSTGEVGFVKIVYTERVQDGVERLGYAVGLEALKAVQKQESLLWKVSEVLTAPANKLDKTAEKIVKELKEANVEKRKLIKELAQKESFVIEKESKQVRPDFIAETTEGITILGECKVIRREFSGVDVAPMIQLASELIKKDPGTITVFGGKTDKTSGLVIMSGSLAVDQGFNAAEVIRQVAPIIGGGGGGRPNFAQGGGTKPEKLKEAVNAAEDAVKKQLNKLGIC